MATLGSFFQQVMRECGDHPADPLLAQQWFQDRYNSVCERAPWPWLLRESTFSTVAAITAGTVTVTAGSATVSETTTNANGWSSSVEGRYFRRDGDSEFYPIDTFTNGTPDTLTLNRVYEGDTGTVKGYTIFQRIYSLASDCRMVLNMCVIDSPTPMIEVSQMQMDDAILNRPSEGSPPSYWASIGRDSSDLMRVELYPSPDEAHGILYHYIQSTPTVADQDASIIANVNHSVLRAGWMSNYWAWRAAHDDAPAERCLEMSKRYELEFERRLQEMVIRECPNWAPQPLRWRHRVWKHRRGKFDTARDNIRLP